MLDHVGILAGEVAGELDEANFRGENPYVVEHIDMLKSILGCGPYYNEGEACAISTACGVMVRISAYTGQMVALNQQIGRAHV